MCPGPALPTSIGPTTSTSSSSCRTGRYRNPVVRQELLEVLVVGPVDVGNAGPGHIDRVIRRELNVTGWVLALRHTPVVHNVSLARAIGLQARQHEFLSIARIQDAASSGNCRLKTGHR